MNALRDLTAYLDPTMPFSVNTDGIFVVMVGGEKLGLPVSCVQTIFRIDRVTPVPGAPYEVIGLVNLRGHIVTAASLRRRLGIPDGPAVANPLTIGIEHNGENFALVVDDVGDVINIGRAERIQPPPHLNVARLGLTSAVYKVESGIISVLDMVAVFEFSRRAGNGGVPKDQGSECVS